MAGSSLRNAARLLLANRTGAAELLSDLSCKSAAMQALRDLAFATSGFPEAVSWCFCHCAPPKKCTIAAWGDRWTPKLGLVVVRMD